jgi:hypothetical protein
MLAAKPILGKVTLLITIILAPTMAAMGVMVEVATE